MFESTNRFLGFRDKQRLSQVQTEVNGATFPSFFFLTFEEAALFIPLLLDLAGAVFTFEASKTVLRTQTSPTDQPI